MAAVSSQQKVLAAHTALAMGVETPPIFRYWDENRKSSVCILDATNRPQDGVTAYATIGLSDHPLMFKGREFDARVELVGACGSAFTGFANVLATAAFCVINSGWFCAPGIIFPDVVSMYKGIGDIKRYLLCSPIPLGRGTQVDADRRPSSGMATRRAGIESGECLCPELWTRATGGTLRGKGY